MSESKPIDYFELYESHPEYVARRCPGSHAHAQIELEARLFKAPNLLRNVPVDQSLRSVIEVGCATGELLNAIPIVAGGRKVGIDISRSNIETAAGRYPDIEFACASLDAYGNDEFDAVILSDVLEHVPDDVGFLRNASRVARIVLINLPLECNWLNWGRRYGPTDSSGHLRKYSLAEGLAMIRLSGLEVAAQHREWAHECPWDVERRELRRKYEGAAYSGSALAQAVKAAVQELSLRAPSFGRRLFSSNLFAVATKTPGL